MRAALPDRPMPNLLRGLLAADPTERTPCRAALDGNPLMKRKFGGAPPKRTLDFRVVHVRGCVGSGD